MDVYDPHLVTPAASTPSVLWGRVMLAAAVCLMAGFSATAVFGLAPDTAISWFAQSTVMPPTAPLQVPPHPAFAPLLDIGTRRQVSFSNPTSMLMGAEQELTRLTDWMPEFAAKLWQYTPSGSALLMQPVLGHDIRVLLMVLVTMALIWVVENPYREAHHTGRTGSCRTTGRTRWELPDRATLREHFRYALDSIGFFQGFGLVAAASICLELYLYLFVGVPVDAINLPWQFVVGYVSSNHFLYAYSHASS